jgi:uncharacterized protein (DUF58 family)
MIRRRILWGILCIASLVSISTYGGIIAYSFFFFCLGLPFISALYLLYVHGRFHIYQEAETRNFICGQPTAYRFILQNDDITAYTGIEVKLFEDFSQVEGLTDHKQFLLLPGEHEEITTRLTCRYRGEYDVGVKALVISDFFGLFRLRYPMPSVIRAIVLPRVVTLASLRSIPQLTSIRQMSHTREQTEIDPVVRDYRDGDPLHKIHWKASARAQTLKVRTEEGLRRQGIVIFLDTHRISDRMTDYLPSENQVLEITIALLTYFLTQNMQLSLIWEDQTLLRREAANEAQFELIYKELSYLSFQPNRQPEPTLNQLTQTGQFAEVQILFLVLQQITAPLFIQAEAMAQKGKTVILYIVTTDDISAYTKQGGQRLQIIAIKPDQAVEDIL